MTIRERQILNWIEENPMISQEKLARKAGITRSAVAVHISNLMKKGHIAGRGYVVSGSAYVAVVGGVNIDIGGRPKRPLIERDSNPGKVSISLGGVGRNIAHNMSLLGLHVRFLTAFGDDLHAQRIEAGCADLGIDISHARKVAGASTSTYLYLNDENGDMVLAVSDMEICEKITPDYIASNLSLLNNAQVVVADGNLPAETLNYLAEHCTAPIFADPVSVTKAEKLRPILGRLNTLKPNRMEAELLSGIRITDEKSMHHAAEKLLDTGLHRVFLSLGADGVFAANGEESRIYPCLPAAVRSTTGAGDAFMAALVWAYLEGMDLEDTVRAASAAAAIATESEETINPALSETALRERIQR
ncbi:MAG: winged helix-turn-helix transcriptional regulator [Oscillospiraceae bacterium]|nr:winged helix-turn-helix transcriptional regulator [Oscillospiraceae bacterium]